jgi:hypothetical protein
VCFGACASAFKDVFVCAWIFVFVLCVCVVVRICTRLKNDCWDQRRSVSQLLIPNSGRVTVSVGCACTRKMATIDSATTPTSPHPVEHTHTHTHTHMRQAAVYTHTNPHTHATGSGGSGRGRRGEGAGGVDDEEEDVVVAGWKGRKEG